MLGIDIIESKSYFTNPNTKVQSLDLCTPSWNTKRVLYSLRSIAIVTDETEMRPDLVSMSYMGDQSGLGTMLKLNNISNPLSIESGEVLAIPGQTMVKDLFDSGRSITNQKPKAKSFRKELQEKISIKISEFG